MSATPVFTELLQQLPKGAQTLVTETKLGILPLSLRDDLKDLRPKYGAEIEGDRFLSVELLSLEQLRISWLEFSPALQLFSLARGRDLQLVLSASSKELLELLQKCLDTHPHPPKTYGSIISGHHWGEGNYQTVISSRWEEVPQRMQSGKLLPEGRYLLLHCFLSLQTTLQCSLRGNWLTESGALGGRSLLLSEPNGALTPAGQLFRGSLGAPLAVLDFDPENERDQQLAAICARAILVKSAEHPLETADVEGASAAPQDAVPAPAAPQEIQHSEDGDAEALVTRQSEAEPAPRELLPAVASRDSVDGATEDSVESVNGGSQSESSNASIDSVSSSEPGAQGTAGVGEGPAPVHAPSTLEANAAPDTLLGSLSVSKELLDRAQRSPELTATLAALDEVFP